MGRSDGKEGRGGQKQWGQRGGVGRSDGERGEGWAEPMGTEGRHPQMLTLHCCTVTAWHQCKPNTKKRHTPDTSVSDTQSSSLC